MPILLLLTLACGGEGGTNKGACPEGQIRDQGTEGDCVDYTAGSPMDSVYAWKPTPGTTWQWVLSEPVDPNTVPDVDMVDLDLFDSASGTIDALHEAGRTVICYFSAGSWEDWRPDAGDFPESALGNDLDGWEGERWLDVMDPTVRDLLELRLDRAVEWGCDGVEPDNVDGYTNDPGLPLNATEQLDFNRWLADAAHRRSLSVGLKNDMDQLADLVDWFDWALNEECAAYDECDLYSSFTDDGANDGAGKAAFHVEYVDDWADAEQLAAEVCGVGPGLDTIIKTWDLGSEWLACD